jgi:DNA-binding transcriptional MerR regulator
MLKPDTDVRGKPFGNHSWRRAMRIGELATKSSVSVRSLRYYEEQGLLSSTRSETGQRLYNASAIPRVILIQQLYSAGLSSRTMRELLPCLETPIERYKPALLDRLTEEHNRMNTEIAALMQTRDRLEMVISRTSGAT